MIVESFKFHLRARNMSPTTIKAAEDYLRPFLATCDPLKVTQRNVEACLADMTTRCTPATVFTAWRHLRTFYQWLCAEGDITTDPTQRIPKPIVPPTEVPIPTIDEIQKLLKCCYGHSRTARRDYALVTVMLDSGLRLSEITNLTVGDISHEYTRRGQPSSHLFPTLLISADDSWALVVGRCRPVLPINYGPAIREVDLGGMDRSR